MKRRPILRLEASKDGSPSVAAIEAEVAKRSQRNWSAFAPKLSTFALSTFADSLAAEEVEGLDAIQHASSQVSVRTSLVSAMTNEVKRDVEAALNAARLEAASGVPAATPTGLNGMAEPDADADPNANANTEATIVAMRQRWEPAAARIELLVRCAEKQSQGAVGACSRSSTSEAHAPSTNDKIDLKLASFAAWPEHTAR